MNQLKIEFVSEYSETGVVNAYVVYDNALNVSWMKEAFKLKPFESVVECVMEVKGILTRHLIANLNSDNIASKTTREIIGSELLQKIKLGNEKTLVLNLQNLGVESLDVISGMLLANFKFTTYKSVLKPQEKPILKEIIVVCDNPKLFENAYQRLNSQIEGTLYARAITSEPPNIMYPEAYGERLKELTSLGIQVEILNKKALEEIGMTAILAVGKGSINPPVVVIMRWMGAKTQDEAPLVLVGKGVCFDAGGLCLKTAAHQFVMKWDKAGAGVVVGTLKACALSKCKANVIGIIGLVENMPDGAASKPGDVITTMSKQTIEIENTDAEGRLVLADCLYYAEKTFKPQAMIDLGTMTMETFASLGNTYAGLYGNSDVLKNELKNAGLKSGDLVWELPMGPSFAKQIESNVADIKNLGLENFGENGAAAEFLKCFVTDTPWAHLDIGGVSWVNEDMPCCVKGVTGFGVRLLEEWIQGRILNS
jgi:leucyl aminopeptidase